jgi:hypothetical protein
MGSAELDSHDSKLDENEVKCGGITRSRGYGKQLHGEDEVSDENKNARQTHGVEEGEERGYGDATGTTNQLNTCEKTHGSTKRHLNTANNSFHAGHAHATGRSNMTLMRTDFS